MFSEEDRKVVKIVLCFFVPMMVVGIILHLCGVPVTYYGDPAVKWIILSGWIVYSFFSWKDKRAFFKRCALALPFALLAAVLLRIAITGLTVSSFGAFIMFMFLTKETKNLKKGFVISLVTAVILIALFTMLVISMKSVLDGIGK